MPKDSINAHKHKQYFTPEILSNFMVNLIPDDNINTVIDLSMGECALLESAKKRWDNASYLGSDIDEILLEKIHKKNPYIKTFLGDSLGDKINTWKEYNSIISKRGFDLVLANPPFDFLFFTRICGLIVNNEFIIFFSRPFETVNETIKTVTAIATPSTENIL